jgi:hypothetical protein
MDEHEQELLAAVRTALREDDVRLHIVGTFTHGAAVQVEARPWGGRWKKAGPLLFPPDGGSLADTLTMLAEMREKATA